MDSELLVYEILRRRKVFTTDEMQVYNRALKGFIGEYLVECFIRDSGFSTIVPIYSSLFEVDGKEFQLDCLLLTEGGVYLFEIKNAEGDYEWQHGKMYFASRKQEIHNPLHQLERSTFLLKRLLEKYRMHYELQTYVVFVNEHFTLFNARQELPFLFPGQWRRFIKRIGQNNRPIGPSVKRLEKFLKTQKKLISRNQKLPHYDVKELERGIFCEKCSGKLMRKNHKRFWCLNCKTSYMNEQALLYAAATFQYLFPEKAIRVDLIYDWCGGVMSKRTINRILKKHLIFHRNGRYSYYSFENQAVILKFLETRYKKIYEMKVADKT